MFYPASQQETDGTVKLQKFEESLMKGLFTKVWAEHKKITRRRAEPQGWREGAESRSRRKSRLYVQCPGGVRFSAQSQPVTNLQDTRRVNATPPAPHTLPHSPAFYQKSPLAKPGSHRARNSVDAIPIVSPQGESQEGAWRVAKGWGAKGRQPP